MVKISQKTEQKQQLSPQQVLQASLLQLSLPLLEQRILHELEVNPALELNELPNEGEEIPEEKPDSEEEIEFDWDELLGDHDDFEYPKTWEKQDEERDVLLVSQETFSERLIQQLKDCDVSEKNLQIAEEVLGNLDGQGYLTIEPMLISDRIHVDEQDVLDVMHKIQRLDPPGIGARNIQECLYAQAEYRNENQLAIVILRDYFDDIANHRYEKIIKNLDCSKVSLNEAMEFIARLNPSPRDDQLVLVKNVVIPDITVEDKNGKYQVIVNDISIPHIRVNSSYVKMLNTHKKWLGLG